MDNFSKDIIKHIEEKLAHNSNYADTFKELKNNFKKEDIINCFDFYLRNCSDIKLLDELLRFLNKEKHKEILPSLIDFIVRPKDGKFLNLKVLAIKTISNYKDTQAVPSLLFCLNDKNSNYKIKLAAAEALGKIGDKNAFEALKSIAVDEKEKSTYVKESAVLALGMLGDNRAVDVFSSIINTKQMFLDKFTYLKEKIVEAMNKLEISKNQKALDILKNSLLDSSKDLRIATIETLMNSNIEGSYNLIYERLKFDDNIEVKKNALVALYNLTDERILHEVIEGEFEAELKEYAKEIIKEYER